MLRVTKRSNFNKINLNNFTIKKWGNNTPKNHFMTFQSQKLFLNLQPQNNNFNKTFCLIFRNFCTNSLKNDKEIENKAGKEKEKEKDCWYCHVTCDQTSQIFCGACKSILVPNPNSNHFELFNEFFFTFFFHNFIYLFIYFICIFLFIFNKNNNNNNE